IGFSGELGKNIQDQKDELMASVMPQDLQKFGMIPEFVGRIPVITSTKQLTEDDLVSILTTPRNALIKQYKRMFQIEGVELEFTDEALREIAHLAVERETGARGLRSICEEVLQDVMFDLPSDLTIQKVIVTKESVEGTEKPIVMRNDDVASGTTRKK
ncbi:MAG: ATP-dependent Clp protease ATP-binding subunit ClpX, partial [Atopobiaceae bacterium]|nr:ATP-dependent Clp protease ATP-binding subunit ClpX [Atopobiaceae bacterium]